MNNAQKAIMIGVGLFITIIIISAVLLIVNLGTGLVDDATSELGTMSTSLQSQILQTYDGKIVSGTQIRAATNQYANDTSLCIVILGKDGNVTGQTGYAALNSENVINKIKDKVGQSAVSVPSTSASDLYVQWSAVSNNKTVVIKTSASDFANSTSDHYINTAKNYNASVIRNGNESIIGIVFKII